jgi:lysophospholipase L1-like esterase
MKRLTSILLFALCIVSSTTASTTLTPDGTWITPDNKDIQYVGRIDFSNPKRPAFNFPGVEIRAAFEGTSLKMMARPKSGYFMVQIDGCKAFKVGFNAEKDSVVTLATALSAGRHTVRACYAIEGLFRNPEFWGFILDAGCGLLTPEPLPSRKIEFIGNSITCGYGVESIDRNDPFEDETENHFYTYANIVSERLNAIHTSISRSGIGVYRLYNGPREGNPDAMPKEFPYTLFNNHARVWDFSLWQPDVVCINLGTNDFSTNNYDPKRYEEAYRSFLKQLREVYPTQKIVLLTGTMLLEKENDIQKTILNRIAADCRKAGDKNIYRFDMTPQTGDLGYGASSHPSFRQHQKMADELTPFLREIMGWQ